MENLSALREIALRRTADRVNREVVRERDAAGKDYYTGEHVLVCLSPSPTNAKVIRTAARMASAFHADFTGILVETGELKKEHGKTSRIMESNINLAKQLGANVITLYGDDIVQQVAGYARRNGISKIVMGRTVRKRRGRNKIGADLGITAGILFVCTLLCLALDHFGLGVINAAMFNYFFTEPRFTLQADASIYPFTFAAMFVCAMLTSSLAASLKREAVKSEAESGYLQILFNINRNFRKGTTGEEILDICGRQVRELLKRNIVIYDTRNGMGNSMKIYPASEHEDSGRLTAFIKSRDEMAVAAWVYKNCHKVGAVHLYGCSTWHLGLCRS